MRSSLSRMLALLSVRIVIVVQFQLLLALFMPWDEAIPWWPFSVIVANAVSLIILITVLKKEKKPFSSIQLAPFETTLPLGRLSDFSIRKPAEHRVRNLLVDFLVFLGVMLLLGIPAIALNGYLSETVPVLRDTPTTGILPTWALYLMTVLLPLPQALIEFPWFFGYIYPRLETCFEVSRGNSRIRASIKALSIVLAFFMLQSALLPMILSPSYMLWRAIAFLPLIMIVGIIIRLVPRLMPWINVVHVFMAVSVVLEYWRLGIYP